MERHYSNRDYEGNVASTLTTGFVFLCFGLISLVLKNFGVDAWGFSYWGFWLLVPAFFILLGGVSQFTTEKRVRADVLLVVRQRGPGRYTLDEIAADAGVKRRHLLRVLGDLRAANQCTYRYDAQSGEIVMGEAVAYEPSPEYQPLPKRADTVETVAVQREKQYCVFCGQKIEPATRYCPNCGSQLF